MCDPTAIAIGSLILNVGSSVAKKKSQDKASEENQKAALESYRETSKDISLLQTQQATSAGKTIFEMDRAARSTQALATVSAGEAGVGGVSVEALLGDIDRKRGEARTATVTNLDATLAQLQREKVSGRTVAQNRIKAVPPGNPFATALEIGGAGLEFFSGQFSRKSPPTS